MAANSSYRRDLSPPPRMNLAAKSVAHVVAGPKGTPIRKRPFVFISSHWPLPFGLSGPLKTLARPSQIRPPGLKRDTNLRADLSLPERVTGATRRQSDNRKTAKSGLFPA
jgi:hypothetical protein